MNNHRLKNMLKNVCLNSLLILIVVLIFQFGAYNLKHINLISIVTFFYPN